MPRKMLPTTNDSTAVEQGDLIDYDGEIWIVGPAVTGAEYVPIYPAGSNKEVPRSVAISDLRSSGGSDERSCAVCRDAPPVTGHIQCGECLREDQDIVTDGGRDVENAGEWRPGWDLIEPDIRPDLVEDDEEKEIVSDGGRTIESGDVVGFNFQTWTVTRVADEGSKVVLVRPDGEQIKARMGDVTPLPTETRTVSDDPVNPLDSDDPEIGNIAPDIDAGSWAVYDDEIWHVIDRSATHALLKSIEQESTDALLTELTAYPPEQEAVDREGAW